MVSMNVTMRYLGEIFGTTLLVLVGCLGCVPYQGAETHLYFPELHFGLVIMIIVHCFGFVSGGHANPCITLACWMLNYISAKMASIYIVAQFMGAALGFFVLSLLLPEDVVEKPKLCLMHPHTSLTWDQTFIIEFLLTSILIFGWCALWDARCGPFLDSVSLRIGFLVTACILAGGQWTGASMNPARTFGPAAVLMEFDDAWIYLGSEFAAGIVAPVVWRLLFSPRYSFLLAKDSIITCNESNESNE